MSCILRIENLKYKNILNGVSLSLEENTFNILVGANGSGKTTLALSIPRLIDYEGQIIFNGKIIDSENIVHFRKEMGILTDKKSLLPGTALYNIIYPLLNLGYSQSKAKEKAYSIAKKLDIDKILYSDITDLLPQEKKLILFATSIIHSPKLIIIDDSFTELDSYYRKKIVNYMKSQAKNSTILFITNNEKDFLLADKLIFIRQGKIVDSGPLDEMLKNEKLFVKNNCNFPFLVDLSYKLISYELLDKPVFELDKMVKYIWK